MELDGALSEMTSAPSFPKVWDFYYFIICLCLLVYGFLSFKFSVLRLGVLFRVLHICQV